jgi:hypothetical protein
VLVVDEYLAVRVLGGGWPGGLPTRTSSPCLPAATGGSCSACTRPAAVTSRSCWRRCPAVTQRRPLPAPRGPPDPRPLLDSVAWIAARYHAGGLLIAETLAAGLAHGHQLWSGSDRNVSRAMGSIAEDLEISVHIADNA